MKFYYLQLSFVVVTMIFFISCAAAPAPDCQSPGECVEANASMCPACPSAYGQICAHGLCESVNATKLSVRADIALHFSLTGDVDSVTFAFIDPRSAVTDKNLLCEDVGSGLQELPESSNIVAAGFVNFQSTSGTALFPDANLGSVPLGSDLLVVRGFSQPRGEGDLIAAACLEQVQISGSDPIKLTVSLRPVE